MAFGKCSLYTADKNQKIIAMKVGKNGFEDRLGERLRQHEALYEESAWENFQSFQKENQQKKASKLLNQRLFVVAAVLIASSVFYYVTYQGDFSTELSEEQDAFETNSGEVLSIGANSGAVAGEPNITYGEEVTVSRPLVGRHSVADDGEVSAKPNYTAKEREADKIGQERKPAAVPEIVKEGTHSGVSDLGSLLGQDYNGQLESTDVVNKEIPSDNQKVMVDNGVYVDSSIDASKNTIPGISTSVNSEAATSSADERIDYVSTYVPVLEQYLEQEDRLDVFPTMIKPTGKKRLMYSLGIGYVFQKNHSALESVAAQKPPISIQFEVRYERPSYSLSTGLFVVPQLHLPLRRSFSNYVQSASSFTFFERDYFHKSHINLSIPLRYHRHFAHDRWSVNTGLVLNYVVAKNIVSTTSTNVSREEIDAFFGEGFVANDFLNDFNADLTAGVEYKLTRRIGLSMQGYMSLTALGSKSFWEAGMPRNRYLITTVKFYF